MRQRRLILTMVTAMVLGLVSFGAAQMMGDNNGQMPMGQNATTSHSATMGDAKNNMMNQPDSLVMNMSQRFNMMSTDFDNLRSHFDRMMQIQDMDSLKTEMQTHYQMMQQMHDYMNTQRTMYKSMLSMMHSGNRDRMMGMRNEGAEEGEHYDR